MGLPRTTVLGVLLVLATAPGPGLAGSDPRADPEALRAAMIGVLESEGVPGVAWALVSTTGVERVDVWGLASRDPPRPVEPGTLFRAASIGKTFIALALARLAEGSVLGFDSPLRELLPDLAVDDPWEPEAPIRLSDLLEHTSGLPDYHFPEIFRHDGREDAPLREVLGAHPEWLHARWRPGTRQGYSNRGYTVAARVLEEKTGLDYEAAIRKEVFEPLGIADATYRLGPAARARLADGHLDGSGAPAPYLPVFFQPAGNLAISVPELAKLTYMFLARGKPGGTRFLRALTLLRLEHPANTLAARAGLTEGTGLGLGARCDGNEVWLGHYGGGYAYKVDFRYRKDSGRGYVLAMSSSFHGRAWGRLQALLRAYRAPPPAPEPAGGPVPPEEAERLTGWFVYTNPRHQALEAWERLGGLASVSVEGATVVVDTWIKGRLELVRTGPWTYRRRDDACTEAFLVDDGDGGTALVGDAFHLEKCAGPGRAAGRLGLVAAAAVALTGLVQGPLALWAGLAGRLPPGASRGLRAFPLLLLLLVLAPLGIALGLQPHELGIDHPRARAVWLLTWAYGLAPWPVLAVAYAARHDADRRARLYVGLVALAHGVLVAAFAGAGWIGLRLWAD